MATAASAMSSWRLQRACGLETAETWTSQNPSRIISLHLHLDCLHALQVRWCEEAICGHASEQRLSLLVLTSIGRLLCLGQFHACLASRDHRSPSSDQHSLLEHVDLDRELTGIYLACLKASEAFSNSPFDRDEFLLPVPYRALPQRRREPLWACSSATKPRSTSPKRIHIGSIPMSSAVCATCSPLSKSPQAVSASIETCPAHQRRLLLRFPRRRANRFPMMAGVPRR